MWKNSQVSVKYLKRCTQNKIGSFFCFMVYKYYVSHIGVLELICLHILGLGSVQVPKEKLVILVSQLHRALLRQVFVETLEDRDVQDQQDLQETEDCQVWAVPVFADTLKLREREREMTVLCNFYTLAFEHNLLHYPVSLLAVKSEMQSLQCRVL